MPSKYYGTLVSDKGESTRAGHRFISASAQSWDGSVTVTVADGIMSVQVREGSGTGGHIIFEAPLSHVLTSMQLDPQWSLCSGVMPQGNN